MDSILSPFAPSDKDLPGFRSWEREVAIRNLGLLALAGHDSCHLNRVPATASRDPPLATQRLAVLLEQLDYRKRKRKG